MFFAVVLVSGFIPLSYSEEYDYSLDDMVEFPYVDYDLVNPIPDVYAQNLEEIRSNYVLDEIDYDPQSLDHFIEKGFRIYTLENQYGEYFIPYKTNATEVVIADNGGKLYIQTDNNMIHIAIPTFLMTHTANYGYDHIGIIYVHDVGVPYPEQRDIQFTKLVTVNLLDSAKIMLEVGLSADYIRSDYITFPSSISKDSIYFELFSPNKQLQNNIIPDKVSCDVNLHLIKKQYNNSPACVTEITKEKLLNRGWIFVR